MLSPRRRAGQPPRCARLGPRSRPSPSCWSAWSEGSQIYWYLTFGVREAYEWYHAALDHGFTLAPDVRAELLAFAGRAANGVGLVEECNDLCRASLACSRDAGLAPVPTALQFLGITALESNHPEQAIAYCDEAVAVAREAPRRMGPGLRTVAARAGVRPRRRARAWAKARRRGAHRRPSPWGRLSRLAWRCWHPVRRGSRANRKSPSTLLQELTTVSRGPWPPPRRSRLLQGHRPAAPRTASGGGTLNANRPRDLAGTRR